MNESVSQWYLAFIKTYYLIPIVYPCGYTFFGFYTLQITSNHRALRIDSSINHEGFDSSIKALRIDSFECLKIWNRLQQLNSFFLEIKEGI